MTLKSLLVAGLGVWFACAAAQADEGLAKIEKELAERWEKLQSFTATMTTEMNVDVNGQTLKSTGQGPVEVMKKGDKVLIRNELKTDTLVKAGGQDMKLTQSQTIISDGENDYTSKEAMGRTQYFKSKPKAFRSIEPAAIFASLREESAKALEDAKVDGADCFVIESTPKKRSPKSPVARSRYYFSKEHGLLLKQENLDDKGATVETVIFKDVKLDAKIDPDRFVFKAPEGAKVIETPDNAPKAGKAGRKHKEEKAGDDGKQEQP